MRLQKKKPKLLCIHTISNLLITSPDIKSALKSLVVVVACEGGLFPLRTGVRIIAAGPGQADLSWPSLAAGQITALCSGQLAWQCLAHCPHWPHTRDFPPPTASLTRLARPGHRGADLVSSNKSYCHSGQALRSSRSTQSLKTTGKRLSQRRCKGIQMYSNRYIYSIDLSQLFS